MKKGFTLIELLVVISIISLLSSVVLASLSSARVRAQDTKKIATMRNLETALAMYYSDNGDYPHLITHTWQTGYQKAQFITALSPYMKIDLEDPVFGPYWVSGDSDFRYRSVSGNDYKTYVIGTQLSSPSNSHLEQNDGGPISYWYELGELPKYCFNKYGTGWWTFAQTVCQDGN